MAYVILYSFICTFDKNSQIVTYFIEYVIMHYKAATLGREEKSIFLENNKTS